MILLAGMYILAYSTAKWMLQGLSVFDATLLPSPPHLSNFNMITSNTDFLFLWNIELMTKQQLNVMGGKQSPTLSLAPMKGRGCWRPMMEVRLDSNSEWFLNFHFLCCTSKTW